ncbi:MAG: hypothetical protein J0H43_03310 [Actinobacteria bacterium]|nr:hypothetical protein [Actinomycetota bacterium]
MSDIPRVLLVLAIIVYVIGRQVMGEPLRGKRVVLLPVVLTVIGIADVSGGIHHPKPVDVALLVLDALVAIAVGLSLGRRTHLESRNGYLWGQLPVRALWLWAALVAARVVLTGVADGMHAHVAASSTTILLMLGINRLSQAAVVLPRAMSAGIPFAPEKDGSSFLAGLTGETTDPAGTGTPSRPGPLSSAGTPSRADWQALAHRAATYLAQRRRDQ